MSGGNTKMKWIGTMVRVALIAPLLVCTLSVGAPCADGGPPKSGEEIRWQVISSGGTSGTSTNYKLGGTVGQTAAGAGTSASYGLNHGFWQDFVAVEPDYLCGDADASGGVDIDDVVYLIAYIFSYGPEPVPLASGDADCSGGVDIDDVVWLIAYIFSGGNAPCDTDGDGELDC
jgi:hypothetical protein